MPGSTVDVASARSPANSYLKALELPDTNCASWHCILVIEDNPGQHDVVVAVLERGGLRTAQAIFC